jgi:hypothetical protein
MVEAIRRGQKTVTRRPIKPQPDGYACGICTSSTDAKDVGGFGFAKGERVNTIQCRYGQPGDLLYVKETWAHTSQLNLSPDDDNYGYVYKSDGQPWSDIEGWRWKSPMFMPKAAARMWLEVVSVRPERLQDITEEDAIQEGIECENPEAGKYGSFKNYKDGQYGMSPIGSFKTLWDSIYGEGAWESNPWVWRVEFRVTNNPTQI